MPEGKRTLCLVEDLTTDGGSKIRFAQVLRDAGAIVNHTFVVFFYGVFPSAFETFAGARMDIALHHLCTWWDVLEASPRVRAISPRARWPKSESSWRTRWRGRRRMAGLPQPRRRWPARRRPTLTGSTGYSGMVPRLPR